MLLVLGDLSPVKTKLLYLVTRIKQSVGPGRVGWGVGGSGGGGELIVIYLTI